MTFVGCLILFVLGCLFPCEGKVILLNGTSVTLAPGSTGRIVGSFDDTLEAASYRLWSFTSSDGNKEGLASLIGINGDYTKLTSLYEVAVETPATLVLKNVNISYNGTYEFSLQPSNGVGKSQVVVYIAVTPMVKVDCPSPAIMNATDNFTCLCETSGGNPTPDVTWYKGNKKIGETGKGEQILRLINVNRNDTGTYRCEAKSHESAINVTEIELIVNYPPENVKLTLTRNGNSATIECSANGRPSASFKIFLNKTELVKRDKTYTISEVNSIDVGNYTCIAKNILGSKGSDPVYLSLKEIRPLGTHPTTASRQVTTTTKANETDVASTSDSCGTEWYIVVSLVSGIIIGIILSYIVSCSRRKFRSRARDPQSNSQPQPTEVDTTYQELDLTKMNAEDNYQSLRVDAASNNAANNDDDPTYTELNKSRDVENNYQSLT